MAYVSMGGTHVTGGVAGQDIQEGRAVVMSASGLHNELPTVMLATANAKNVFVALMTPDQFPRPTPAGMFARPYYSTINPRNAVEFLVDSGQRGTHYLVGPSLLENPTIASGWMVQLHKGGVYCLQSGTFTDAAAIRVPGATVAVGANGIWVQSASNVVGYVREYRNGKLYLYLDPTSA